MNESTKIKTIIKMINERLASKAVVLLKREPKALWVLLAKCYQIPETTLGCSVKMQTQRVFEG